MDPTLKMSQVFIAILTCHLISTSSAIKITITTNRYNGVLPTSFDVTCTLDPKKSDNYPTKRIVAIKVSRHGERPLAVLQQNSKIFYDRVLRANIQAKGHIDQVTRNSNMTVTFTDAMKEDSGVYTCSLLYFDRWGYMQREEASTNVTIENNNAHDVLRYLVGELESMQNQLAELDNKTTIIQIGKDTKYEVALIHLLRRLTELENRPRELEDHKEKDAKVETELEQPASDTELVKRGHEKEIDTFKTQHVKDIGIIFKTQLEKDIDELNSQNAKQNEEMDALKKQQEKDIDTLTTQLETLENQTTKHIMKVETELEYLANDTETVRRQYEKDIETLNTQNVKQNEKIDALKKQHEKDIDELNTQNVKQNNEMDALKKQHQKDIDALRTQQKKDIDTLKTQLETFEAQTTKHITKANLQSGFMAALKAGDFLLYHKTNKFRDVQLNIGNHYDAETSVYTAPWDGLYTFYLTAVIRYNGSCLLDIRVNERVVSRLMARAGAKDQKSSVSAFVSLKTGDAVDVYGYETTGRKETMFGYFHPDTSFSGFLIKAT